MSHSRHWSLNIPWWPNINMWHANSWPWTVRRWWPWTVRYRWPWTIWDRWSCTIRFVYVWRLFWDTRSTWDGWTYWTLGACTGRTTSYCTGRTPTEIFHKIWDSLLLGFMTGLDTNTQETLAMSWCLFICFVALRPKSTAMVMVGRSVHLTTPFPGQAWTSS